MIAAEKGHKEIVAWLVQEGKANVDIKDNIGKTACMIAAEKGHKEIVALLMQEG